MGTAYNPILKGFNPDPSIIRVGEYYYIATSTFEWFPGVQIHRSKNLINWELVARPLNRMSQLDMRGVPDSGGIWAPCLSFSDRTFYLVYTNVKNLGLLKDTHNYLVKTTDILGDWSEPIFLNSNGFDPSLFHDENGRKYLVCVETESRPNKSFFDGILLQEYDDKSGKLIGDIKRIYRGTELKFTEGPHIYKINGMYYLSVAEGGTAYNHAQTMARAKDIFGPYTTDPNYPLITTADDPALYLQKAGHADIVQAENGEYFLVHLCGRPLTERGNCVLGRETAIQSIYLDKDGWFKLKNNTKYPDKEVPVPYEGAPAEPINVRYNFDEPSLPIDFQSLRVPLSVDVLSFERKGYLRLYGSESLNSKFTQALVARRQQSFCFEAKTYIEFEPSHFKHNAGLIYYYNTACYYYLKVSYDEKVGKCISMFVCDNGVYSETEYIPLKGNVYMKLCVEREKADFFYSYDDKEYYKIGETLDASKISDEYARKAGLWTFTGAFVGICCQDMTGNKTYADFDFFEYSEITYF